MKSVDQPATAELGNKDYTKVWQSHIPQIAWGTLLLFIGIAVGYIVVLSSTANDYLPYPIATLMCTYFAFVSFTVLHEAGHGAIFQVDSKLKPFETVIGWIACLPFMIVPYKFFQKIHDRHHAFTNDPDRDPDKFNLGERWYHVVAASIWLPLQYYTLAFTRYRSIQTIRDTWPSTVVYLVLMAALLVMLVWSGYAIELLCFAVIPAVLAMFFLAIFFDYIPHHPHKSLSRYHNTRIYPSSVLNILLLGQNYHLIHHLYPRLPWYTYRNVYMEILPELKKNNAAIENIGHGFRPSFMKSTVMNQLLDYGHAINMLVMVKDIEKLTNDSVAVTLQLPQGESLKFKAGQYITVSKWLNGHHQTRCYSLCDAPGSNTLRIAVKKTTEGLMSGFINQDLKVGDEVVVKGPFGTFVYPPKSTGYSYNSSTSKIEELVLIAGGSGITPILSIMKTSLATSDPLIHLIYASHNHDELMFLKEIDELMSLYTERLKVSYVVSRHSKERLGTHRRLSEKTLTELIQFGGNRHYYICGPIGLKEMTVATLSKNDVEESCVHVEEFTKTVNEPHGEQFNVMILMENNKKHIIKVATNQSILEVANARGIAIPHACGDGTCGSCKCKLRSGKVRQIDASTPGITDLEQAAGYTLACRGFPEGDVTIQTL